jgi:RNA polymerase sigma-70 factor (ECF subfamily)
MQSAADEQQPARAGASEFATTRWSLVLGTAARDAAESRSALETLCRAYWYPIYAYIRRRVGDIHEGQDLTQSFFERLLEKGTIATADPQRGRFRAFLLTACQRFLINEWEKARAAKRGGGRSAVSLDFDLGESRYAVEAVDSLTPERLYEQQWAVTLLGRVLDELRAEYAAKRKETQFERLKEFLSGASRDREYASAAAVLGMTEAAVRVAAHRMRGRYRELLRAEIAQTLENPEDVDDEIRSLFSLLGPEKT